jgi:dolichol-phosphate mannosyltransferase
MSFSRLTVVIPAKNEASNIGTQIRSLLSLGVRSIFVADDGSTDFTPNIARSAGVSVIPVPNTRIGLAGVYRFALKRASLILDSESIIVEMDAGGSHSHLDLYKFLDAFNDKPNLDVAFGRRFGKDATYDALLSRKLLSYGGTFLTNLIDHQFEYKQWWKDATSGYIAYKKSALDKLLSCDQIASGHYYQTEMRRNARKLKLNIVEIPITYVGGFSHLKLSSIKEALRCSLHLDGK